MISPEHLSTQRALEEIEPNTRGGVPSQPDAALVRAKGKSQAPSPVVTAATTPGKRGGATRGKKSTRASPAHSRSKSSPAFLDGGGPLEFLNEASPPPASPDVESTALPDEGFGVWLEQWLTEEAAKWEPEEFGLRFQEWLDVQAEKKDAEDRNRPFNSARQAVEWLAWNRTTGRGWGEHRHILDCALLRFCHAHSARSTARIVSQMRIRRTSINEL